MSTQSAGSLVPAVAHAVLDRTLGPDWKTQSARVVEGSTNHVVHLVEPRLAVRVPRSAGAGGPVDRRNERAAEQAAAQAGIAPEPLAWDDAAGVLVTRWLDGIVWSSLPATHVPPLNAVAELFRRLHAVPPPPDTRQIDLLAVIDGYLGRMSQHAGPAGPVARELRAEVVQRLDGAHTSPPVLTHNDAHRGNILQGRTQRLYLLDWEYAGIGDPLFDLAAFAGYYDLTTRAEQALLGAYGGDPQQVRGFRVWRWIFDYIWLLWLLATDSGSTPRPDGVNNPAHVARLLRRLGAASGHSRAIE